MPRRRAPGDKTDVYQEGIEHKSIMHTHTHIRHEGPTSIMLTGNGEESERRNDYKNNVNTTTPYNTLNIPSSTGTTSTTAGTSGDLNAQTCAAGLLSVEPLDCVLQLREFCTPHHSKASIHRRRGRRHIRGRQIQEGCGRPTHH